MRVAYLRGEANEVEVQTAMEALENAGCDRVVFDSTPRHRPESRAALLAFLERMKAGDDLVVTSLDQISSTTPRLIEILVGLLARGITVKAASGEIDTADATAASILQTLWRFEERNRRGRKHATALGSESVAGRPRRLAADAIALARQMIEVDGRAASDVAVELGVSRATLYRSLKRL